MLRQIYVNLPVKDLARSVDFFSRLGFTFNPQFTDQNATCMVVGENINVMLLVEKFFKTFTKKDLCDPQKNTEVIVSLSFESREKVNELVETALQAGAVNNSEAQDHGWMYQRGFADPDGHQWEFFYMDVTKFPSNN